MIQRIARKSRRKSTEKRQATAKRLGTPIGTTDTVMEVTTLRIYRVHYSEYSICPRCGIPIDREYANYCSNCGQRLSWESYLKEDIEMEFCPPIFKNEVLLAEKSNVEKCLDAKYKGS